MGLKEQMVYKCDACGVETIVERVGNDYPWPKTWQHLDSRSQNIKHICTACVTSFKAWLKSRRERAA